MLGIKEFMQDKEQLVCAIKYLLDVGLPEKLVVLVTQAKQPYVNKIKNGKLHRNTKIEEGFKLNSEQQNKYEIVKKILFMPELPTSGIGEQDVIYMQLLKFFMIPKDKIIELYNNLAKVKVSRLLLKKKIDLGNFDSELIGVDKKEYLELMIEFL